MKGIIYKITNEINDKIYIGQTIRTIDERWRHHVYYSLTGLHKTKLARAIRKYGKESFKIEILEETEDLDKREIFYISFFKSDLFGYNIKIGGNGGPHAESTKKKISKANRGRVWTGEMRHAMSEAIKKWHKKRGFVPSSEETKKKISKGNMGRKMSDKTRAAFQKHNRKNMKPVVCINTNKEYESIMSACRDLNLNDGHLRMHLKGKHSHVKGFRFKFK